MVVSSLAFGSQMIQGTTDDGRRYIVYVSRKGTRKLGVVGFLDLFLSVSLATCAELGTPKKLCKDVESIYVSHNFCGFYQNRQALADHVCYAVIEGGKITGIYGKDLTALKFSICMFLNELFNF